MVQWRSLNISLSEAEIQQFKLLCKKEFRGPSDEFRYILNFYLTHKDNEKK